MLTTKQERETKAYNLAVTLLLTSHRQGSEAYSHTVDILRIYIPRQILARALRKIRELERDGKLHTLAWVDEDLAGEDITYKEILPNGPSPFPELHKPTPQSPRGITAPVKFTLDPRLIFTEDGYCTGYKDEEGDL